MNQKFKFGMVGGGDGSLIGPVHLKAAEFDRKAILVAGCFSRNFEKTLWTGKKLGLANDRLYQDYKEMAIKEGKRKDKIDFVIIVTPNNYHFEIAKIFFENQIHVVCDKPLTLKVSEADELVKLASEYNLLNCVTYTYIGYPMVKNARRVVKQEIIGKIHMVRAEYLQEWLARPIEKEGNKQAFWRTNPNYSGKSNCLSDIGSHIENIITYITDLKIESLCANLESFVKGRKLDDNAEILLKYKNGARGLYWCSQVAIGSNNGLKIDILGEKGSIRWEQEKPNSLRISYLDQPTEIIHRGRDLLFSPIGDNSRLPAGHPEGFYEALANIYSNFVAILELKKKGEIYYSKIDFPTFRDGRNGIKFIQRCVESSQNNSRWINY